MTKVHFHFSNNQPIYVQLIEILETYIISGQFSPGEQLPPTRDLANLAKVNPNTMQRALQELEDKKLVVTNGTRGRFVTEDVKFIYRYREHLATQRVHQFLGEMRKLGLSQKEVVHILKNLKRKD